MKNKEIFDLYEGLYEIGQDKSLKFEIRATYILAKNKNILEPYYNAIIDTRQKILEKYGEQQEGGEWRVEKEKMDIFMREWNAFMEIENFINIEKVGIEELKGGEIGIELMGKLLPIINY